MNEMPEGFEEKKCRNHPDRACVDPMAFQRCQECKDEMLARYADNWRHERSVGRSYERSTDGRDIQKDNEGGYRRRFNKGAME